jgi:hypothetical protein
MTTIPTHHVVVDEGAALLDEPRHGERQVLHRPVRHRATERREPGRIIPRQCYLEFGVAGKSLPLSVI